MKKQMQDESNYEKIEVVAVYDSKYATNELKSVKTKSVGHRFIKNN